MPQLSENSRKKTPQLFGWFSNLSLPLQVTICTIILLIIATAWLLNSGAISLFSEAGKPQPTPVPPNVASIVVSPASGSYSSSSTFTIAVNVTGAGVAFNAAKATVTLSSNLSVQSVTPGNCNMTFVTQPSTVNLSFAGAILANSSTACTVYTATLKPVSRGTATVTLSNGSIKAYSDNSEMLGALQSGTYSIKR